MNDLSEWVMADSKKPLQNNRNPKDNRDLSGWVTSKATPASMRPPNNEEGLGMAALKSPFRVGEDLYRGAAGFVKDIPGYFGAAKTEVPGWFDPSHPIHRLGQATAGIAELGHNLLNAPRGVAEYAANRLNLIPKSWAENVPFQKDISEDIRKTFGDPKYAGESLARGVTRNVFNLGLLGIGDPFVNPLNLTKGRIVRNVLKEGDRQVAAHSTMYNNLWKDAERAGLNYVPVDHRLIDNNLRFIDKYKSPRDYKTLEYFNNNPTLPNAQSALSDLRTMTRSLDKKSRTQSLSGEERNLHDALSHTEKHIEGNMFLNPDGDVNNALADRYRHITNSYRENVVPYRYNPKIQAYKKREITKKQLVNSLSEGEFAAKKGSKHPAIKLRELIKPLTHGVGIAGGLGFLYHQMFGDNRPEQ